MSPDTTALWSEFHRPLGAFLARRVRRAADVDDLLQEVFVRIHKRIDTLAHPEPGFYVIGSKSYGRAPTFLLATGYEQARSVAAMLAGDREAALRVELDLPETGVCTVRLPGEPKAAACCVPAPRAAPAAAASCCA